MGGSRARIYNAGMRCQTHAIACALVVLLLVLPAGAQSVVVSRQNNSTVMYAVCATQTASTDTYVPPTWVLVKNNDILDEQTVDDGSITGTASQRYAFGYTGASAPPVAGAAIVFKA